MYCFRMARKKIECLIRFYTILCIFLFQVNTCTAVTQARAYSFSSIFHSEQEQPLFYVRVGFCGVNTAFQCLMHCVNLAACRSFYVDDATCVIGVDDVTADEENDVILPAENQIIQIKGKSYNIKRGQKS